eukprot:403339388
MSKERKVNDRVRFTEKTLSVQLKNAAKHHIESFEYAIEQCLPRICQNLLAAELSAPTEAEIARNPSANKIQYPFKKMLIWFENFQLRKPIRQDQSTGLISLSQSSQAAAGGDGDKIYPSECRIRSLTYSAPLYATIARKIDNEPEEKVTVPLGDIPVMIRSSNCHLYGLTEEELVKKHEDMAEFGGYFIINGNERIVRMLIMTKRNYPVAFSRPTFINRGKLFTPFAVQMRCVRDDLFAQTLTLHYLSDGNCSMRLIYQKQEFLIPAYVILKALADVTDAQIYNKLVKGYFKNRQIGDRVEVLLQDGNKLCLYSQNQCLAYLGSRFRMALIGVQSDMSDIDVGNFFIQRHLFVQTNNYKDKFNTLCIMIEKLYAVVAQECELDNLDSPSNQEVLLSGHLYASLLAEKLQDLLIGAKAKIIRDLRNPNFDRQQIRNPIYMKKMIDTQVSVGKKMEHFLATGNLISRTNLDLISIHRGQYFAEMKTTTVRKLLPEAWGFLCPVHTPDGGPCGLLNHITSSCIPLAKEDGLLCRQGEALKNFKSLLAQLGMNPISSDFGLIYPYKFLPILLDGVLLGYVDPEVAPQLVKSLRALKIQQSNTNQFYESVPKTLEVSYLAPTFPPEEASDNPETQGQTNKRGTKNKFFPGIFLASSVSRFVRPVQNLEVGGVEWIGPLEQVNLSIACLEEDIRSDTTHQEIDPINVLSMIASTIPFADYNQSPRNMYQCQMAKQTMGTPYHNHPYRMDNKVYRILFPQEPLVRTENYNNYDFRQYPSGTNAVVAVISYTGYDMEDAMIINKSAYERGFGHGCVYKSYIKEVNEQVMGASSSKQRYRMLNQNKYREDQKIDLKEKNLDTDGIPSIGHQLTHGSPELCTYDTVLGKPKYVSFKDNEPARVENVRLMGDEKGSANNVNIGYTIRYERNPVIGDKFSSRHGQKGVLSVLWPQEDMPFTESGISPDIIINPHAFPSRMTIGMLVESIAGKSGSNTGEFKQVKTFEKYEDDDVVQYFGQELLKQGYNYYGTETMYSGIFGDQMKVDIFIGVVYYQRLRHMVSDKSQARATGPYDVLTHQPVKGRKKQGGIRFGEMERDSLLAHGAAFCLNDRLLKCSDYSEGYVCKKCGSIISCHLNREILKTQNNISADMKYVVNEKVYCRVCDEYDCRKVQLPYVLRYLTNELAAMNIKLAFHLEPAV